MADTLVFGSITGTNDIRHGCWGPYWIDDQTAVIISVSNQFDISSSRTTDAGANWSSADVFAGTALQVAAWFDQETPGDTGTLVHMIWSDSAAAVIHYRSINVADGTLGTLRTIDSGVTISTVIQRNRVSITKTVSGNLLVAFSTDTENECYRSVDGGANWVDRADVHEAPATERDWVLLFPADTGDDDDACALYWDLSAGEISVKMYDDFNNTWTETSIDTGATGGTSYRQMDGAVRHSDKHVLVLFHSNDDDTLDDLRTYDLTVDSIASPNVATKTVVFTDQSEAGGAGLFINQQNDDVYAAYIKGNPTWEATSDVVFHISTDGMGVWGSEQAYSEGGPDDFRLVHAGRTVGNDGGRYQPVFYDDDQTEITINEVNDIEIAAAVLTIPNKILQVEQAINRAGTY